MRSSPSSATRVLISLAELLRSIERPCAFPTRFNAGGIKLAPPEVCQATEISAVDTAVRSVPNSSWSQGNGRTSASRGMAGESYADHGLRQTGRLVGRIAHPRFHAT